MFLYKTAKGIIFLLVYVDDIIITRTDSELIAQLQWRLQSYFHIKDLTPLFYFLVLEVNSSMTSIFVYQHKYI